MKTLVNNKTNESVYLFSDDATVELRSSSLYLNDQLDVENIDPDTFVLVEDVTPPDDWIGNKYLLVDGAWILNENADEI